MIKHATASVYVFDRGEEGWLLGLVEHPRFTRWMVPGGHVEAHENAAEAARREVAEELGRVIRLVSPDGHQPVTAAVDGCVPRPFLIVEQVVPADRVAGTHIHVDHLYLALAGATTGAAELPVRWCRVNDLDTLHMFDDTRIIAKQLFSTIGRLTSVDKEGVGESCRR